jgi:hypothetical protein
MELTTLRRARLLGSERLQGSIVPWVSLICDKAKKSWLAQAEGLKKPESGFGQAWKPDIIEAATVVAP